MFAWYFDLRAVIFVRDNSVKHVWLVERAGSCVIIVNLRVREMFKDGGLVVMSEDYFGARMRTTVSDNAMMPSQTGLQLMASCSIRPLRATVDLRQFVGHDVVLDPCLHLAIKGLLFKRCEEIGGSGNGDRLAVHRRALEGE